MAKIVKIYLESGVIVTFNSTRSGQTIPIKNPIQAWRSEWNGTPGITFSFHGGKTYTVGYFISEEERNIILSRIAKLPRKGSLHLQDNLFL